MPKTSDSSILSNSCPDMSSDEDIYAANDVEVFSSDDERHEFNHHHRRKRINKEDAIYGIFGDERSAVATAAVPAASNPILFQKSTPAATVVEKKEAETNPMATDERLEDVDNSDETRNKFNDLIREGGGGKSNADFKSFLSSGQSTAEDEDRVEEPSITKKHLKDVNTKYLGTWEKHTKGFGMKMLQKMGFKGRLGKDEQGISASIAVKVRPNKLGLGYGNFQEAASLKQNKKIENELHGTEESLAKEAKDDTPSAEDYFIDYGMWKKTTVKKKKIVYKTAQQVLEEVEQQEETKETTVQILDLRGPTQQMLNLHQGKTATTIKTVSKTQLDQQTPQYGQELLYNINLLIDLKKEKIIVADRKLQSQRNRMENLKYEYEMSTKQSTMEELKREQFGLILQQIQEIKQSSNSFIQVCQYTSRLQGQYQAVFRQYVFLRDLIPALLVPAFQTEILSWEPDTKAKIEQFIDQVKLLKQTLRAPSRPNVSASTSFILPVTSTQQQIFDQIISEIVLPRLRVVLSTKWNVAHPESCFAIISILHLECSTKVSETCLSQMIFPRLQIEVERWNPKLDPSSSIQHWLLLWKELLGSHRMSQLYLVIRHKLAIACSSWHPRDTTMRERIQLWQHEWDPATFQSFLERSVVPKLVQCLRRELRINPKNQQLDVMKWICEWKPPLVDSHCFAALFEGEFFPPWLNVLRIWLCNAPQLGEILQWYQGWKQLLPSVLLHHERIRMKYNLALYFIQASASGQPLGTFDIQPRSFQEVRKIIQTGKSRPSVVSSSTPSTWSFKEVVESFAAEHDVIFQPNVKREPVEGKQLYAFGRHTIYIDQDVVYLEHLSQRNVFHPVALESLLSP